jgi:hypothetical protein
MQMAISNQQTPYKTTDTALAAYLYCKGFRITDIDYTNQRADIYFDRDTPEIREHARLYFTDIAQVTPSSYSRISKRLSNIIRNHTQWTEDVLNA